LRRAIKRAVVAGWRTAAGLARPSKKRNARSMAREKFARNAPDWFCLVIQKPGGELVGFAQANRSDHPEFAGELNKIYVLEDYQHLGLGKRLLGHVARRLVAAGMNSMWLFGDARNPSNKVWKALGAEKTDDDPGTGNYGWRDLRALAALPE
jgi:GNAT superfamily N-acetyltransferase